MDPEEDREPEEEIEEAPEALGVSVGEIIRQKDGLV